MKINTFVPKIRMVSLLIIFSCKLFGQIETMCRTIMTTEDIDNSPCEQNYLDYMPTATVSFPFFRTIQK
jgi:hypothetical protein